MADQPLEGDPYDEGKLEVPVDQGDPVYIVEPEGFVSDEEQEEFDRAWLEGDTVTEDGYVDEPKGPLPQEPDDASR